MIPILFFKFDRSKWFLATYLEDLHENCIDVLYEDYSFSIYNVDNINLGDIDW